MPARYQSTNERQDSLPTEQDLFDDSTGVLPTVGVSKELPVKERLIQRLGKMLAAQLHLQEGKKGDSIDIFLSRDKIPAQPRLQLDEELQKTVRRMEDELKRIASNPRTGPRDDKALEDLWESILCHAYGEVDIIIHGLRRTFDDYYEVFGEFISRTFGIEELDGSILDDKLGTLLIRLHQDVRNYKGSMKQTNLLIYQASEMTRVVKDLQVRFKHLFGRARFGDELYEGICNLGFPERVHSTLVRAAKSSRAFQNVKFHLRPASPMKRVSFAALPATPTRPEKKVSSPPRPSPVPPKQQKNKLVQRIEVVAIPQPQKKPQLQPIPKTHLAEHTLMPVPSPAAKSIPAKGMQEKSKRQQIFEATVSTLPAPAPASQPPHANDTTFPSTLVPYLSPSDLQTGLRYLPASKRDTAQLIFTILSGSIPPSTLPSFYTFGFIVCKNTATTCRLAGLYQALLREASDPQLFFRDLSTAVEKHSLVDFFDKKEYPHFRTLFPRLEAFLSTPKEKRWTVWRLRIFLLDTDNTNAPAILQRDYGFKFCRQHEEVLRLKLIYEKMLKKLGPEGLHGACVHGRLYEMAIGEGISVGEGERRLMINNYPKPFVGFENELGLAGYRGALFKKAKH